MKRMSLIIAFLLLLGGCTPAEKVAPDPAAMRHFRLGERYEHSFLYREATMEYSVVAQNYPASTVYPSAILHLALLYGNQANPVRNDSLALRWIKAYLALPLSQEDQGNGQLYLSLIDRISTLQQRLLKQQAAYDSVAASSLKAGGVVLGQAKRIQELEADLQRTRDELKRLKEVDIRTSKRAGH